MIEKWTPELLTLFMTFYDVSVLCNRFSSTEMRQFGASGTDGLKCFSNVLEFELEELPYIIYDIQLDKFIHELVYQVILNHK